MYGAAMHFLWAGHSVTGLAAASRSDAASSNGRAVGYIEMPMKLT